jgi:hypothetical protein
MPSLAFFAILMYLAPACFARQTPFPASSGGQSGAQQQRDNDLAERISRCVADASFFYRISFDPPCADHADEYHDPKVAVDKSGLIVRTNAGYYNQP